MIIKNCALFKKSLSAVALLGAVLNTSVFGMDQRPQNLVSGHNPILRAVPADIWNQMDNILGVKNIKGRNTVEKALLLKETIGKPHQYDLKDKGEDFVDKLMAKAIELNTCFGVKVDFDFNVKLWGYDEAIKFFKSAKKFNAFINLKCENWPGSMIYRLLLNENATQIVNLDLRSKKTADGSTISNWCSTLKNLGEALSKSNLTNLKVLNLSGLYFSIKENPFKGADLDTPFVNYLHLEKMPKLEVLNLKGVNIDRRNYRNWAPEITKDLENIEKTSRPSLGQYSRIRIQK